MINNVIGTVKYDLAAGTAAIVVQPLAGTSFNLPDAGTDPTGVTTGTKTYGRPVETLILTDRLDASQAKYEIVQVSTRVAEAGGAYTYAVPAGGRGAEGTTALAWTASNTVYVLQVATAGILDMAMLQAVMRSQLTAVHKRDGLLTWDGSNFKFDTFRFGNVGKGNQFGSDGYITVAMPANGKTVTGVGGAGNYVVAGGVIVIPESNALYFEPNIGGANTDADVGDRFKLVANTTAFVVPRHWLLIAAHVVVTAGDKALRVCNGATLWPWIAVLGGVGFTNSWVNFGGAEKVAAFYKDLSGRVYLGGTIKNGTNNFSAFTLPAGFRPAAGTTLRFNMVTSGGIGEIDVAAAGTVLISAGSGTTALVQLDGVNFLAES